MFRYLVQIKLELYHYVEGFKQRPKLKPYKYILVAYFIFAFFIFNVYIYVYL